MFEGHDQAIHDLLAERRLVEPSALRAASAEHEASGRSLAAAVLDLGLLDKPTLFRAIAAHLGCDYDPEPPASLPPDALALIGADLVRAYGIVPVAADVFPFRCSPPTPSIRIWSVI